MRDLLTDLVRRTLRPERAVRPRLPSWSTPAEASDAALAITTERDARAVDRTVDATGERPRDSSHPARPSPVPLRSAPASAPVGDSVDRPRSPVSGAMTATAAPTHVMAPARPPAGIDTSPRAHTGPETRHSTADIGVRTQRGARHEAPAVQVLATHVRPALRDAPQVSRRVDGHAAPRRDNDADDGREPATPAIHITIGRIDVRPPAPERRAPRRSGGTAAAPQSLEAYLDARGRGGRR